MSRTSAERLRRITKLYLVPSFYSQASNPVLQSFMHISKGLRQSYQVQDLAFEALLALRDSLMKDGKLVLTREDSAAIKHLADVWATAQMRISFHRRVPSPGVARPERKRKRSASDGPLSPDLPVGVGVSRLIRH